MADIVAKNRSTGVESEFTHEQWNKVKKDPKWRSVFTEVPQVETPQEVLDLQKRKQAEAEAQDEAKAVKPSKEQAKK